MEPTLPEDKRTQLDGIVKQMIRNKESDSNIRFVVDDFKKKYTPVVPVEPVDNRDFLQKTGDVVNAIFPGKQVGQAIGTLGGYGLTAVKEKLGMAPKGATQAYDTSAPTPLQVGGDIAQGALSVAAPNIGKGASVAVRIAANTALGAGVGGAGAVAEGEGLKDVAKGAALGGAVGGGISAVGEGVSALAEHLPKWFAKLALPKMKDAAEFKHLPNAAGGYTRTPQESAAEYALQNAKGLTMSKMVEHSNTAVEEYGKQIKTILSHPEYKDNIGHGAQAFNDTMKKFPEAGLDKKILTRVLKFVGQEHANLVDKVREGTATLAEKNTLRQTLDKATKKVFTDHPNVTFNKEIAHEFANALRAEVQTLAPETAPIFNKFSKELTLNQALQKALNKKTVAGDLIAGGAGFAHSGLKGAAEAILAERTIRNPAVLLNTGKLLKGAGKLANPLIKGAVQATKAPLTKEATFR